ncbi:Histone deacetylase complex subunit SAP18 [Strongyloides ratti]|uniref:18 kDa Sin3-associated polypeptide n=1 Tax=Strongyloides ratti TaxID=34506 RepID=A0A090LF45_STRRB|nr:Histone deacetylase complex subunit SAP18 [Strongyloides ratti]CEF68392.1 Histone deacetylase complex subunit SAP18 [Strongyloides ratti]
MEGDEGKITSIKRALECPFLIKIFIIKNQSHPFHLWKNGDFPKNVLYYQTRLSCTLLDLTKFVNDELPEHFKHPTILQFRIIQFDVLDNSCHIINIGTTRSDISTNDENSSLERAKFDPGNFLEIVIKPVEMVKSVEIKSTSNDNLRNYDNHRKRNYSDRSEEYSIKKIRLNDNKFFDNKKNSFLFSKGRKYR